MSIEFYQKTEYVGKAYITSHYAVAPDYFLVIRINDQVKDQVETHLCPGTVNTEKLVRMAPEMFYNLLLSYYLSIAVNLNLKLVFDQAEFVKVLRKEFDEPVIHPEDFIGRVQKAIIKNLMLITRGQAEPAEEGKGVQS